MNKKLLLKKYGLEQPFRIRDKNKKYAVFVKNPATGNVLTIKFGAVGYQDFLEHKDPKRRKSFKARHRCSSKSNKLTPGYWSCNYSW